MKYSLIIMMFFGLSSCALPIEETSQERDKPILCTMDVKICPDGQYVSRKGPSCSFAQCPSGKIAQGETERINFTMIGSAETPDPVLEKVLELEKKGLIWNVIIMESFPVQIQLTAPQDIIDMLKSIPTIKSPAFR
ncbi:hypothetical protein MNBD_ALPHA03-173 [hydrothermal vent metagenome]|uniref:Lipoprotein n=1 Tax=hydrothermal vent metagenome TaxID=652676 RepID=A0A3B1AYK6_9ZZZZ